jgi:glycosyltransferase involved in cell wall biosynthesis
VVITSYNKGVYLRESIGSILEQSYPNVEIVVVNDGSSDDTSGIVTQLICENPGRMLSLVEQENRGVSVARNVGLSKVAGRVVMVLDGDDKVAPQYIERALIGLRQHRGQIFRPNQQNFGNSQDQWMPNPYDPYTIRYDNCFPTPSIFDRRLFEITGGYKPCLSFCEDWEFWLNCSKAKPRVVESPEFLTFWRNTDTGLHAEGVQGKWQEAFVSIAILNQECYPVQEVLTAHQNVPHFPPSYLHRFEKLLALHPQEWFLPFIFGLIAEHAGNIELAIERQCKAQERCGDREWQPYFRLGLLARAGNKISEACAFLHEVRTRRPDMAPLVNPVIKEMAKS